MSLKKIGMACSALSLLLITSPTLADFTSGDWVEMSDEEFATAYADMAFSDSLQDREIVAWLLFARTNQQIEYPGGTTSLWKAWATDEDTFQENPSFVFNEVPRQDPRFVTEKNVLAGKVAMNEPNGANEESVRNELGYDYIVKTSKMNTYQGVLDYVRAGNKVDLPVGSIEIKASWISVKDSPAPEGALTFEFAKGTYWFRGMHIMAKMRPAPDDLFYTADPSWFWTTFEFNNNIGVQHVRDNFITQRAPLDMDQISEILAMGGIEGIGFEAYAPNGTQIRYTVNGDRETAVILGHTNMEDFAGVPEENPSLPANKWTGFNASCHTCHATAAINPDTGEYFPFSVPVGGLTPQYTTGGHVLGEGFVPLDFMWPIPFHAAKP